MKKRERFSDQLRRAVQQSDLTRYQISKQTGIDQSILSRFVNRGAGLSMESVDKLVDCLGLRLAKSAPSEKRDKRSI